MASLHYFWATLNPLANSNQKLIFDLAIKYRSASICARSDYADNGCLMAYGSGYSNEGKDGARYVDRIPKGTKPADIPVEQPTKFELVINLKTAKQIGLTIPPNERAGEGRSGDQVRTSFLCFGPALCSLDSTCAAIHRARQKPPGPPGTGTHADTAQLASHTAVLTVFSIPQNSVRYSFNRTVTESLEHSELRAGCNTARRPLHTQF